jgi:phosphate acetyltransferase
MTKNVFIASAEPYSGKSIVSLGLVNMLLGKAQKVGYFKPIINPDPNEKKDVHIETISSYFSLPLAYEDSYAFTRQQALKLLETESQGELIDTVIHKIKKLEEAHDFIIIDGSDFVGEGTSFELDANINIARNVSAPVIIVVAGDHKTVPQIINSALTVWRSFEGRELQVISMIVNKVPSEHVAALKSLLKGQLPETVILSIIPEDRNLNAPP